MDNPQADDHPEPRSRRPFDGIVKLLLQRKAWRRWWMEGFTSLPAGMLDRLTAWPTEWVSADLKLGRSDTLVLAAGADGQPEGLILIECQDRYEADMGLRLQAYAWAAGECARLNGVEAAAGPRFWVHATVFNVGARRWPAGYGLLGTSTLPEGDPVLVREPLRVVDIHAFSDSGDRAGNPWECMIQLFRISHALRDRQVVDRVHRALSRIRHQMAGLHRLLPLADHALRHEATNAVRELFYHDFADLGYELPDDISLEDAAMMYETIAEGIKASLADAVADATAEGEAKGRAEGRVEEKTEQLLNVVAHFYPEQVEAFRHFLASHSQDRWPEMSEVLSWTGTGDEFMDWVSNDHSNPS